MHNIARHTPAETFQVKPTREGWQALKNGHPLGRPFASEKWAWAQIDRHKRKEVLTERPCLTCSKPFASEGPHNRMCTPCRNETVWPF
tara:strand:- start:791 stop:1054 length:264 start_codon:yes stop_codon:yes gene_type:complete